MKMEEEEDMVDLRSRDIYLKNIKTFGSMTDKATLD
jgi:hypothetical protein